MALKIKVLFHILFWDLESHLFAVPVWSRGCQMFRYQVDSCLQSASYKLSFGQLNDCILTYSIFSAHSNKLLYLCIYHSSYGQTFQWVVGYWGIMQYFTLYAHKILSCRTWIPFQSCSHQECFSDVLWLVWRRELKDIMVYSCRLIPKMSTRLWTLQLWEQAWYDNYLSQFGRSP